MTIRVKKQNHAATVKFQDVSFKNVQEFLDYLPEEELRVVKFLRKIVFDCLPEITEKLSYNVPFYRMHRGLFFIWPSSVKWGKGHTWSGVRFGFQQGYLLADDLNYLDKGGRKQVYWRNFSSVSEIDADLLKSYIFEAAIVDQQLSKSQTPKQPGESKTPKKKRPKSA